MATTALPPALSQNPIVTGQAVAAGPAMPEEPKPKSLVFNWLFVLVIITAVAGGAFFLIGQNQLKQQDTTGQTSNGVPALDQTGTAIEEAVPGSGAVPGADTGLPAATGGAVLPNP